MFLLQGAVMNPDPIVRCAAGEALGRIAQAVGSPVLTSNITQKIFDQLKAARDAVSRTGYSVALGCIHRYVGGMASGHHLNSSVSILLALAKDNSSSLVQVCSCNYTGLYSQLCVNLSEILLCKHNLSLVGILKNLLSVTCLLIILVFTTFAIPQTHA